MGDKVYIAGPMSGYEEFNFPAFNRVEELLRKSYGYKHVINPAKLHPTTDLPWVEFLKQDLRELITCDAVFLLKGWEKSRGATLEARTIEQVAVTKGDKEVNAWVIRFT